VRQVAARWQAVTRHQLAVQQRVAQRLVQAAVQGQLAGFAQAGHLGQEVFGQHGAFPAWVAGPAGA